MTLAEAEREFVGEPPGVGRGRSSNLASRSTRTVTSLRASNSPPRPRGIVFWREHGHNMATRSPKDEAGQIKDRLKTPVPIEVWVVDLRGLEPLTSTLPVWRSPS